MRISKLTVRNIKCFKELEIPFVGENGQKKDWTLLVGNNGQGKTTVLRCLALGLCSESEASGLLVNLYGQFSRQSSGEGYIRLDLVDGEDTFYTETLIRFEDDREILSRKESQGFPRKRVFSVAYGSGRDIVGTDSYEKYDLVDSMSSLFNYEYSLQNAELVARRVLSNGKQRWNQLRKQLKEILMLGKDEDILLNGSGIYVDGKWGQVSFNSLSDGYQSLTSVILDFLGWRILYTDSDLRDISGIFIIDEIEQHLHPKWQRNIIKIISEQFPNVQFIGSTHSPICVLGLDDVKCGSQMVRVSYVNGHSDKEIFIPKEDYKGYRIDQILTSDIFSLSDARSLDVEGKLEEYREIYLKDESKRSDREKRRAKEIEEELKDRPLWENQKDREIKEKLISLVEEQKGHD